MHKLYKHRPAGGRSTGWGKGWGGVIIGSTAASHFDHFDRRHEFGTQCKRVNVHVSCTCSTCMLHVYVYICVSLYLPLSLWIHTYIHTYIRTYVRTYIHTYIHTYIYVRMYVHMSVHEYIHTRAQYTCIHTCTHTYMQRMRVPERCSERWCTWFGDHEITYGGSHIYRNHSGDGVALMQLDRRALVPFLRAGQRNFQPQTCHDLVELILERFELPLGGIQTIRKWPTSKLCMS